MKFILLLLKGIHLKDDPKGNHLLGEVGLLQFVLLKKGRKKQVKLANIDVKDVEDVIV